MWLLSPKTATDPEILVESYSLFARKKQTSFLLSQVQPIGRTMHPMASFKVKDNFFFIHPEGFEDARLLEALVNPKTLKHD